MKRIYCAVILAVALGVVWGASHVTPSEQCPGQNYEDLRDRVQVEPCGKTRCKLHKGQNATIRIRFTPKHEIKTLITDVSGIIAGLPLPFIGVHGTSACPHVALADTGEPAPCPLAPGRDYIYTNVFPIESFYPTVPIRVHWGLNDGKKDVICFELAAVIS